MREILLLGAVQSFFLSLLLLTKKTKNTPDYILVILLLLIGLPLFIYYLKFNEVKKIILLSRGGPSLLYFINLPLIMAFMPSLYLYIKANIKPQKKFFLKNIIHYSPIFLFIILSFFIVNFDEISVNEYNFFSNKKNLILLLFMPLTLVLAIYYIYKSFLLLKNYNKKIKENYSFIENIELEWLKNLLISAVILLILIIIVSFILAKQGDLFTIYKILFIILSFLIFVLAFFGFKQSSVFYTYNNNYKNKKSSTENVVNADSNLDLKKLHDFMIEQKPYLESNLTIKQLANMINWQTQYLSRLINENLGKNFYEFVNFYRVEEFKKQIKEKKNYTILAVAFECGFNSKSSFNRIFKQFTNLTPSQYKKKIETISTTH